MQDNSSSQARPLVYLATERTLMACMRAAVGLMALGFVIDRFGLVVRRLMPELATRSNPPIFSFQVGVAFVITGVLLNVVTAVPYWAFAVCYRRDDNTEPWPGLSQGIFLQLSLRCWELELLFSY